MRRRATIVLHWSVFMLLLAMIKGGSAEPALRWAFVGAGAIWLVLTLRYGLLGKAGPKLQGGLRRAYPWMHRGLYACLAVAVGANAAALQGYLADRIAWNSLLVLLGAGTFHGLFHFWRHNVLYDNALRMILPRFMHKIL
jgi:superoxide oxidase